MKVNVGSQNPTKINSVKNLVVGHSLFKDAVVTGVNIEIEEFGHPKSLEETVKGAMDRAKASIQEADYGFGIESGLVAVPYTKSGYMETTVCAIYDGENYHLGVGPAFEWPKEMLDLILSGKDGSQAFKQIGLTTDEKVGTQNGGIHVLTNGKINRTKLNELSVMMALIHLENKKYYN
jgi:inosine/xanthosine triphosphatase